MGDLDATEISLISRQVIIAIKTLNIKIIQYFIVRGHLWFRNFTASDTKHIKAFKHKKYIWKNNV